LLKEVDVNPLVITNSGFMALDARIVTYPLHVAERDLPPLAIRPYPEHYVDTWRLRDGTLVIIRPIRPEDEPLLRTFHQTLSEQSIYLRYFHLMSYEHRVAHERLVRRCFIDYDREMALVAEHQDAQGQPVILGIGRIVKARTLVDAEFSLLVSDRYQALGLGTELLRRLINIAQAEQVAQLTGYFLQENTAMQRIALELGFTLQPHGEGILRAYLNVRDPARSRA
jgi:acetyltransferase